MDRMEQQTNSMSGFGISEKNWRKMA